MTSLQNLRANLAESEKWGLSFREQIKALMLQINTQNRQISDFTRQNITMTSNIQKLRSELKTERQINKKMDYKLSKNDINCQEIEARIQIAEEACLKKQSWKTKLTNKEDSLKEMIRTQQTVFLDNDDDSQQSEDQQPREQEIRDKQQRVREDFELLKRQFIENIHRLKAIELTKMSLDNHNKKKEQELNNTRERGQRLRTALRGLNNIQNRSDDKENQSSNAQYSEMEKRVDRLEKQSRYAGEEINNKLEWISECSQHLSFLMEIDKQSSDLKEEVARVQRQFRKEYSSAKTISSYLNRS